MKLNSIAPLLLLLASTAAASHFVAAFGSDLAKGMTREQVLGVLPKRYALTEGPTSRIFGVFDRESKSSVGSLTLDENGGLVEISKDVGQFTARDAERLIAAIFDAGDAQASIRNGTIKVHPPTDFGQVAEIAFADKSIVVTRFEQPGSPTAVFVAERLKLK